MSTKRKKRKKQFTAVPLQALPQDMRAHMERLGLATVEEYFDWCKVHGYVQSTVKSTQKLDREVLRFIREGAKVKLRETRRLRRPDRILLPLLEGEVCRVMPEQMLVVNRLMGKRVYDPARRCFTRRLLKQVVKRCPGLLWERLGEGTRPDTLYLRAVLRMAQYHDQVLRPIETWRPRSHSSRQRILSLAQHLFASWPVPKFLHRAWFQGDGKARLYQRWFLHIGAGNNIRSADLPLPCSKKMAHYFMQAPADYKAEEALRWGQVHALGGDARLADCLRGTLLCQSFMHHEFWESVIRFFIRYPKFRGRFVRLSISYLQQRRFESQEFKGADGVTYILAPEQPSLSMRGRSMKSFVQEVREWCRRPWYLDRLWKNVRWSPSGIQPFRRGSSLTADQEVWSINELLTSEDLHLESLKMRHCVAAYAEKCLRGHSSIWTLVVERKKKAKKLLTIEVDPNKREIVEALGPCNRQPKPLARTVLQLWAKEAGLAMAEWV